MYVLQVSKTFPLWICCIMSSVDDEKCWKILDDMLSSLWVVSNHLVLLFSTISYLMRTLVVVVVQRIGSLRDEAKDDEVHLRNVFDEYLESDKIFALAL